MKWEMEVEEIEAVLEKIWDLHDKLSDAIHSISRIQFINSIKTLKNTQKKEPPVNDAVFEEDKRNGFVFVKDFRVDDVDDSAIQEAKSLNAIRTALENLEDQLEFFHTIQIQQRAERDVAMARLEQSRTVLATRLAEHHGKRYKVIEEALAFVGDVHDHTNHLISLVNNLYAKSRKSNITSLITKVSISSFNFAKNCLNKMDHTSGVLGNAALVAISMLAMLHFHGVGYKENFHIREGHGNMNAYMKRNSRLEDSSSRGKLNQLDVSMARG